MEGEKTFPKFDTRTITKTYARVFESGLAVLPAFIIAYLHFFQDPARRFSNPVFHEIAITAALLTSGFVGYVTWQCYQSSGEVFLRWLALGFMGFTTVYTPHGLFTRFAEDNLFLFMLYGPASRFVLSCCLLIGLFHYGKKMDPPETRKQRTFWGTGFALFIAINILVGFISTSAFGDRLFVRLFMEGGAGLLLLINISIILWRRIRSPLMLVFTISLAYFAQSSISFIVSGAWNHQWWLAHAIFASGFFYMGYGVVQAFHTTRSFSTVYSQEEMMAQLTTSQTRTQEALQQLQKVNKNLSHLATTDPLTGVSNRRHLLDRILIEISQTTRIESTFSLLAIDLDHFKDINDRYGHAVGDRVLIDFVKQVQDIIRPADLLGRMGGEEFTLLLPHTPLEGAAILAERIRQAIKNTPISVSGHTIPLTISIGAAQFGLDGENEETLLEAADKRLYHAKESGRNRVMSGAPT